MFVLFASSRLLSVWFTWNDGIEQSITNECLCGTAFPWDLASSI